jgi:ubiquinone/menaquinone biosynthesis C-methylase UbiE
MERYVLRGGQPGYERLQLLARVHRPDTDDLFRRAGVGEGSRCLDLGCGGGEVTFDLARLAGPSGSVVGVDMDQAKLALARHAAARDGYLNVEFLAMNVGEWDEPASYDLVYCRFLVQHLSQPADLLRRMWSAVRPGGVIAVEDADFDGLFCDPDNAGFDFYRRMYPQVCTLNGGDPVVGRKLGRYFAEAGISNPELRLVQCFGSAGEIKALGLSTLEASADAIVSAGLATAEEVAAAIADLSAFVDAKDTIVGDPRTFQIWARK